MDSLTNSQDNFITQYLNYIGYVETPTIYNRWSCLSMLGALLGRQYQLEFGHFNINPNQYVMLIGTSGARKSTAIKVSKKILSMTGYDTISADKSSKEKFMLDLAGIDTEGDGNSKNADNILDNNLWGDDANNTDTSEMYIACDEFNDFIGNGNLEFISLLGNLWDFEGVFKNRIKNGKSVNINNPTVNILGGNTPTNFVRAFPTDTLGQGFFGRLLLIYGEPTGRKITFPVAPTAEATASIVQSLMMVKQYAVGKTQLSAKVKMLIDKIYKTWSGIDDIRFESYATRRLTHMLKLCLIISASNFRNFITEEDVVIANTVLTHTENLMPKALGEFGKSRNSDITHKVMSILNNATYAMPLKDIWEIVHNDMDKLNDLAEMVRNLVAANKVITVGGGFLPNKKVIEEVSSDILDYSCLTQEERNMVK